MAEDKAHIHLILPKDERDQLRHAAEAACRSVQGEIQHRLRLSFASQAKAPDAATA